MSNAYTATNSAPLATLPTTNGVIQNFFAGSANTGASTFAPDGLATAPILGLGGSPLQGGEIISGGLVTLISYVGSALNSGALCWVLFECAGGAQQVATGTASQQAATVGQVPGANLFVNGLMRVDQRNNGASQTFTAAAAIAYCIDQWYGSCTGANVTGQRASLAGGYTFTGLASNTGTLFGQRIESYNSAQFISANVTVQAKISSTSITSVTWNAYYANTQDNFASKTLISTGTITVTSTPTVYNFTFNAGANAANGIAIEFVTGALLATQTLSYSAAKLELGSAATVLQPTLYSADLAASQRYGYQAPVSTVVRQVVTNANIGTENAWLWLPVEMRAAPTVPTVSWTTTAATSISVLDVTTRSITWQFSETTANSATGIANSASFFVSAVL